MSIGVVHWSSRIPNNFKQFPQLNIVISFSTFTIGTHFVSGIPAISVPTGLSSRGLPIGLQLMGQRLGEDRLLSVAKWLEQQVEFPLIDLSLPERQSNAHS